jgi:hypothetical protein
LDTQIHPREVQKDQCLHTNVGFSA